MPEPQESTASESTISVIAAIVGNLLIAVTKFVAFAFTRSSAMLSEGIHSVVDTGNGALMLWGVHKSKKPPDAKHPLGHGRELYFWSLIVAVSIFGVGGGVSIYEGIMNLRHPIAIESPVWSYATLGASFVFEGITWIFGWRAFSKTRNGRSVLDAIIVSKDPTSFTVLLEDSTALLGLIVAFVGVFCSSYFGLHYFDGAASIVIGVLLCSAALLLGYESKSLLIGESVLPETLAGIREIAKAQDGVVGASKVWTIYTAPENAALILELDFEKDLDAAELMAAVRSIADSVRQKYPKINEVFFRPQDADGGFGNLSLPGGSQESSSSPQSDAS